MQPQTMQILLFVALVVIIVCVYFIIVLRRERDKYLFKLKPIESEKNRLVDEVNRLKIKADEPITVPSKKGGNENKSAKKNAKKPEKSLANIDVSELKEKNRTLESEITRLKEQNYNLSQDNKSLRKDIKDNNEADQNEQREVITLRESQSLLQADLDAANTRITELEKQITQAKSDTKPDAPTDAVQSTPEDAERLESLNRENASLQASLKDVRGELAAFKRDYRTELDAAKKEVADSNRALRKDLSDAQRQMQQSKKRADNNHKLYLIARAQTLIAQKRLAALDPSFKPIIALPVKNNAIEEIVKKFSAFDAREKRASDEVIKLNEKIRLLENENQTLKSQSQPLPITDSIDNAFDLDDESLSDLVKEFSGHASISMAAAPTVIDMPSGASEQPAPKQPESASLADLSISGMDDDWDSL